MHLRRAFSPAFSAFPIVVLTPLGASSHIREQAPAMLRYVAAMLARIEEHVRARQAINFDDLMGRLSLGPCVFSFLSFFLFLFLFLPLDSHSLCTDIIGGCGFGCDFGSLSHDEPVC